MEKDVSWKEYFRDDERYADVINGIGFGGRQLVKGENLEEADTQTILGGLQRGGLGKVVAAGKRHMSRIRTRDLLRKVAFGVSFAMIGLENQELVDYAMPLRCMIYDAGEYEKQAGKVRKMLRKQKGLRGGEYLYGFGEDSKLCPVVTFVLYSGREQWDGPRSLHDILDIEGLPEEMRELVADYPFHLIDIRRLKDTNIFQTDVKQVFDFIRCAEDKEELFRLVKSDERFRCMEEDAYEVATNYAGAEELIKVKDEYRGKEGKIDMCKALKELIEDGRVEGIRSVVIRMIQKGKDDEEIMELTGCSVEMLWETKKSMKK